ncbi:MAG: HigA family addiction module antitoxin [Caldilineaceae bacterium]
MIRYAYQPLDVPPPGETVEELLEHFGMSQAELARRMGRPQKTINEIILGKAAITHETALQLERVLGTPAHFWLNGEARYREFLARQEDEQRLREQVDWVKKFPIGAMTELGWLTVDEDPLHQLQALLAFFGIAGPEQFTELREAQHGVFRKTQKLENDHYALAAWLRRGEIVAQEIGCHSFDKHQFRATLQTVRALTLRPFDEARNALVTACAQSGVAVVLTPELPKIHLSGVARWLTPQKALIQLTCRYKRADHFWFSFFHEAGHLVLHQKSRIFIDTDSYEGEEEGQANRFAQNELIPPHAYQKFRTQGRPTADAIKCFATEIGIAPGIVVGRLQHDDGNYQLFNHLRQAIAF